MVQKNSNLNKESSLFFKGCGNYIFGENENLQGHVKVFWLSLAHVHRHPKTTAGVTWASFLQGEDLQVETVEQSEVLLSEEHHAPLHTVHLPTQAALITHGQAWRDREMESEGWDRWWDLV